MALTVLFGSPHSGYTDRIYDEIIREAETHPERNCVLLVPEQASLTAQEALVSRHPDHALKNIDVLTFQRFARKVFLATDTKMRDVLDDVGKKMMLRVAIDEIESSLTVLKRSIRKEGMVDELNSVISEFAEYNVTPETLRDRLGKMDAHPALRQKLNDVTLVYETFLRRLHERYDMTEEKLLRLSAVLPKWSDARSTSVWCYGYTGFTPPQYEVIRALLGAVRSLTVGVVMGSNERPEDHEADGALFSMSTRMVRELTNIASDAQIPLTVKRMEEPKDPPYAPEIRHLEANLFRDRAVSFPDPTDRVRAAIVRSPKDEVAFLTSEVLSAIRSGLRYRDVAVSLGEIEDRREEIEAQFTEAGIPYFIDENRAVGDMILFRLVTSALEVSDTSFGTTAVFDFLKNPIVLTSLGRSDAFERVCEMENYASALGIRSKTRFSEEWTRVYRHFDASHLPILNDTKDRLLAPLYRFHESMVQNGATVGERIRAIRSLVDDYRTPEALRSIANRYEKATGRSVMAEYEAGLRYLNEFLDRAEEILGDGLLRAPSFRHVLLEALRNAVFGRVPATKDRVIVGNLRRTRFSGVKKLYILGANEETLLPDASGAGLLNDSDREVLRSFGVEISETASEQAFDDRFYLYLLLTVPSDSLTMVYSMVDEAGSDLRPAGLISSIRTLFPEVKIEQPEKERFFGIVSKESGLTKLAADLSAYRKNEARLGTGRISDETRALYHRLASKEAEALALIMSGLFYRYKKETLEKPLAKALYGETLEGSVSRLERFANCPYAHFLDYGLRLDERQVYEIGSTDPGLIYHDAIDRFFTKLNDDGADWRTISDEEQNARASEAVRSAAENFNNGILQDSAKNRFLTREAERIVKKVLRILRKHWQAGAFTETKSELKFEPEDGLQALSFRLPDGTRVRLRGKIDRIDTLQDETGATLVKIIDYKSYKSQKFDLGKLAAGVQIQLPIYLKASLELTEKRSPGSNVVPAGIYYFYIHDPVVLDDGTDPEEKIEQSFRMNGLTNDEKAVYTKIDEGLANVGASKILEGVKIKKDETLDKNAYVPSEDALRAVADYGVRQAKTMSQSIMDGNITVEPYRSACDYCKYRPVCGRDESVPGFRTRTVDTDPAEILKGSDHGLDS